MERRRALFEGMFFDPRKYDFSRVGRLKFNIKLYEKRSERAGNAASGARGFLCDDPLPAEAAQEHRHRLTISITSAIAAFAPLANCWKTSSASV